MSVEMNMCGYEKKPEEIRQLVVDLSPQRPGFVPASDHVRFVVD
jgi:hypothetical protein